MNETKQKTMHGNGRGISCDNEITKEEIDRIYRIEYMATSNWSMGYNRTIWVVEFDDIYSDDYPRRSLYIGKPLVPAYREYKKNPEEYDMQMPSENMIFSNHYPSYYYSEILDKLEVWNWMKLEPEYQITDGGIMDIAFFTKDSEGKEKICRYQIAENEIAEEMIEVFDRFFDMMNFSDVERVVPNKEMMDRSDDLLPGGYINANDKEN